MQLIVINTILYIFFSAYLYNKSKTFNLQIVLFLWYTFIAICGLYAVNSGIYYVIYGLKIPKNGFVAYLYIILLFYFLTAPLKTIGSYPLNLKENIYFPRLILNIVLLIFFFYFLLKLYETSLVIGMDMRDVYTKLHEEGGGITSYTNPILIKLSSTGFIIYNALYPFVIYYFINLVINGGKNRLFALLVLFISVLPQFLTAASGASRGGFVFSTFDILFFFFIFRHHISRKLLYKLLFIFFVVFSCIFIIIIVITSDRVGDEIEYIINGFTLYLGEAFPNVLTRYWNSVDYHPMGERLFGLQNFGSLDNFFQYWSRKTHVAMECFKTLPIDVYIEFGKFGGICFILALSFFMRMIIKKEGLKLWTVGLIFWYYQLCVAAIFSFIKRGEVNFKILILTVFVSLFLYKINKKEVF